MVNVMNALVKTDLLIAHDVDHAKGKKDSRLKYLGKKVRFKPGTGLVRYGLQVMTHDYLIFDLQNDNNGKPALLGHPIDRISGEVNDILARIILPENVFIVR